MPAPQSAFDEQFQLGRHWCVVMLQNCPEEQSELEPHDDPVPPPPAAGWQLWRAVSQTMPLAQSASLSQKPASLHSPVFTSQ
jgi:hypothetical protein